MTEHTDVPTRTGPWEGVGSAVDGSLRFGRSESTKMNSCCTLSRVIPHQPSEGKSGTGKNQKLNTKKI
jgi:hypothetical protein